MRFLRIAAVLACAAGALLTGVHATAASAQAPPEDEAFIVFDRYPTDDAVRGLDLESRELTEPIPTGFLTISIEITPDGTTAYATGADGVVPIDLTSREARPMIALPESREIAISPDGTVGYVSRFDERDVVPIDLTTDTAGAPIPLGGSPRGIAFAPDGNTVWVAVDERRNLTPIDVATRTRGVPIDLDFQPYLLAIEPLGDVAYLTASDQASLVPVDLTARRQRIPIALPATASDDVEISHNGLHAYVLDGPGGATIPVDLTTATAGNPIPTGDFPDGIDLTQDDRYAYVADNNDNQVVRIDLATNLAEVFVTLDASPRDIAIRPSPPGLPPPAAPAPVATVEPQFTG